MEEIWKLIVDFPNYQVSNLGRIKNKNKILKPRYKQKYIQYILYANKKPKDVLIHRLVASAFVENKFNKPDINHKDGNRYNNHFLNLEWATKQENSQHAWDNFLYKTTFRKVTGCMVLCFLVDHILYNKTFAEIGRCYGVKGQTVRQHIFNKTKRRKINWELQNFHWTGSKNGSIPTTTF